MYVMVNKNDHSFLKHFSGSVGYVSDKWQNVLWVSIPFTKVYGRKVRGIKFSLQEVAFISFFRYCFLFIKQIFVGGYKL